MAQIPPIDDGYIDEIIKSNGPYNPSLITTQGTKMRELIKMLRDRMEQGDTGVVRTTGDQSISGTKTFTLVQAGGLSINNLDNPSLNTVISPVNGIETKLLNITEGTFGVQFSALGLSALRSQTLQDKSGVIALTDDIAIALETKANQSDLEIVQAQLAGKANLPDELVTGGETTVDGNDVTVAAATWRIEGLIYLTEIVTPFEDIANSSVGNQRYVAFYGNANDDIVKIEGVEVNIAVMPALPPKTALISSVLVGDAGIGEPIIDTSGFALKADLGDKTTLITDDRLTVVAAVNEIKATLNSIESDQITLKIFKVSNYATP